MIPQVLEVGQQQQPPLLHRSTTPLLFAQIVVVIVIRQHVPNRLLGCQCWPVHAGLHRWMVGQRATRLALPQRCDPVDQFREGTT